MPSEKHQLSDAKTYITLLVQGDRFPTKKTPVVTKKREKTPTIKVVYAHCDKRCR